MNPVGENHRADWYPDPWRRYEFRFHNGTGWTADVSTGGNRYVDPFGIGPATGSGGTASPSGAAPPAPTAKRERIATAAMVLGIIGLSISWMPVLVVPGAICALLGATFGIIAWRRRRPENRSFAITGVVTGGAGLVMVGVGVWTTAVVFNAVDDFENPPRYEVAITTCAVGDSTLAVGGTIENVGGRSSDYRIIVRVPGERALSFNEVVIEVDDVAVGAVREFNETFPLPLNGGTGTDAVECTVGDVTGPLPFGLDIDSND